MITLTECITCRGEVIVVAEHDELSGNVQCNMDGVIVNGSDQTFLICKQCEDVYFTADSMVFHGDGSRFCDDGSVITSGVGHLLSNGKFLPL